MPLHTRRRWRCSCGRPAVARGHFMYTVTRIRADLGGIWACDDSGHKSYDLHQIQVSIRKVSLKKWPLCQTRRDSRNRIEMPRFGPSYSLSPSLTTNKTLLKICIHLSLSRSM